MAASVTEARHDRPPARSSLGRVVTTTKLRRVPIRTYQPRQGRLSGRHRTALADLGPRLTLHADGRAEFVMTGASTFPRHWVYDDRGQLSHKSGLTDFRDWYGKSFGRHSPWGDEDSPALVTAVETALERSLSVQLMHGGAKPRIERLPAGSTVVRQGDQGTDIYLVLDGVIRVERDGEQLAEYGPGALLGERAHLEGGIRTSTLVAVTACRLAAVDASQLDRTALEELSGGHRREDAGGS